MQRQSSSVKDDMNDFRHIQSGGRSFVEGKDSDDQSSAKQHRLFLRHLSNQLQDFNEFLLTLNQHLVKESEINDKALRNYMQSISNNSHSHTSMQSCSKDEIFLQTILSEVRTVGVDLIRNVSESLVNQKNTFNVQLKRLREVCNQATRNAIQVRVLCSNSCK